MRAVIDGEGNSLDVAVRGAHVRNELAHDLTLKTEGFFIISRLSLWMRYFFVKNLYLYHIQKPATERVFYWSLGIWWVFWPVVTEDSGRT